MGDGISFGPLENCSVTIIELSKSRKGTVIQYGDASHLHVSNVPVSNPDDGGSDSVQVAFTESSTSSDDLV